MRSWDDICADPSLRNLPYKVETNRNDQLVLTQAPVWYRFLQSEVMYSLRDRSPTGKVTINAPVTTEDGVKVADVAWISDERAAPYRRASVLPIAPEICVEIVAPENREYEMLSKTQLYFAQGAQEVWLCDEEGQMQFFLHDIPGPSAKSRLCPDFPLKIEWE